MPRPAQILDNERLVGEAHVHDRRWMTIRGRQVDEPPFAQESDGSPVEHPIFLYEGAHRLLAVGQLLQGVDIYLHVEVAAVGDDGAALHGF